MSKSFHNAVSLSDTPEEVDGKLSRMMTDPQRVRRTDPGDPALCPAFHLHRIYCSADEIAYVTEGCRTAKIGCLECKKIMIRHVIADLEPIRARRAELDRDPEAAVAALEAGNERARREAAATMEAVREAMKL